MSESRRRATIGVIPVIIVLGLAAAILTGFVAGQYGTRQESAVYQYSDNGLTCTLPGAYHSASIASLVSEVTHDSRFLKMAASSPFVFGNAENITGRSVTTGGELLGGSTQNGSVVGGTTIHLPNVLEMVFYSYGPGTTCVDMGLMRGDTVSVDAIVVQIPIESGVFNVTGATFSLTAAGW